MIIILRLLLILLPIIAVVYWVRWRMKVDRSREDLDAEIAQMRRNLILIASATAVVAASFYLLDEGRGDEDMIYVPPRVEDGKMIPGHFIPREDKQEKDKKDDPEQDDGGQQ